jgi:hypothetical protein
MDLRDNATALSQAGDRAQTTLDTLRRRRLTDSGLGSGSGVLSPTTGVDDLLALPSSEVADRVTEPQRRARGKFGRAGAFRRDRVCRTAGRTTMH